MNGGADAQAALAAVDGIEDNAAIRFHSHRGAGGGGPVGDAGVHLAVFQNPIHGAHSVLDVVPAGVFAGDVDVHCIAHLEGANGLLKPFPAFVGDRHDELAIGNGGGAGGLDDLLHGAGDGAADL